MERECGWVFSQEPEEHPEPDHLSKSLAMAYAPPSPVQAGSVQEKTSSPPLRDIPKPGKYNNGKRSPLHREIEVHLANEAVRLRRMQLVVPTEWEVSYAP
jgi:hypothetical protein